MQTNKKKIIKHLNYVKYKVHNCFRSRLYMHGKLEFLQTEETSLRCFNRCGKDKSF